MAFSFGTPTKKKQSGFSLIELLIVVAIMGVLTAVVAFSIREMIRRGKVAKAQADLNYISKGIRQLELDVGNSIGGASLADGACISATRLRPAENPDGLMENLGYTGWKGPYLDQGVPAEDPWGNPYLFQSDYACDPQIKGCEDVGNNQARVVFSGGENGSEMRISGSEDVNDTDDVVLVLCK